MPRYGYTNVVEETIVTAKSVGLATANEERLTQRSNKKKKSCCMKKIDK